MDNDHLNGPWLCHVCDMKSTGPSKSCSACYKTTCNMHLQHVTVYNPETGLYQLQPVCLECAIAEVL